MRSESTSLSMQASHQLSSQGKEHESLRVWVGSASPPSEPAPSVRVDISHTASPSVGRADCASGAGDDDPRLTLIRIVVELLTGRRVDVVTAEELRADAKPAAVPAPPSARPSGAGFGLEYGYQRVVAEQEQTDFSAEGVVLTTAGEEIHFSLEMSLGRSFPQEENVSLRVGEAMRTDPLVINFDARGAQLSGERFASDLDTDGYAEDTPLLAGGSGYPSPRPRR